MNKEQYLQKRNELINKARGLIEESKIDEANAIMDEVKELDEKFEKQNLATANLNALQNNGAASPSLTNLANIGNTPTDPINTSVTGEVVEGTLYRSAFLKNLMGKELTNDEKKEFERYNAAMTVDDNQIVIPNTTASKIWEKMKERYPFYAKTLKTSIKGAFTLIQESDSSNSKFYDESTETETGSETLKPYQLTGCELSRCIDVSWKLKAMSMDDFEDYIVRKMADKMGAGAAHSAMTGKGKPGKDDLFKPEPYGVITTLEAEDSTPRIITVSTTPTYKDITQLLSKVKSGYDVEFYATNDYIWNVLANIVDSKGRPYFIPDPSSGGVGRMLGKIVNEDASVPDNNLLLGDAGLYQFNFNKNITLDTEDSKKKRITSYIGYAIVDGAPITNEAFALLKKAG